MPSPGIRPKPVPEFHVGDKVCVTLAGRYMSGTVTDIFRPQPLSGPEKITMYQLDDGPWWPESRLDYDINPEQKVLVEQGERVTWELFAAAKDADAFWLKAKERGLPPALLAAYRRKIRQIIESFAKQAMP